MTWLRQWEATAETNAEARARTEAANERPNGTRFATASPPPVGGSVHGSSERSVEGIHVHTAATSGGCNTLGKAEPDVLWTKVEVSPLASLRDLFSALRRQWSSSPFDVLFSLQTRRFFC